MLAKLLLLARLVADCDHCSKWVATPWGPKCADIKLDARCMWSGWHTFGQHQGISVCVRACEGGRPTQ